MNKLEFKGTDGKWTLTTNPLEIGNFKSSVWSTNKFGEEIGSELIADVEKNENAHLIAAAPDLLKAAIDFLEKVESGRARSTDSYNKFKSAVYKALNLQEE